MKPVFPKSHNVNISANTSPCACGCGGHARTGRFLRGHERRRLWEETAEQEFTGKHYPPEYRLLLAVFEEAWDHKKTCPRRALGAPCPLCYEDRAWCRATAAYGAFPLFTFIGACEVLGLDADRTRHAFLSTSH